jgi:hypothetical protein
MSRWKISFTAVRSAPATKEEMLELVEFELSVAGGFDDSRGNSSGEIEVEELPDE